MFEVRLDQLRPASRPNSAIFGSMMNAPAADPEATLRDWCMDNSIIGLQSNQGRIEGGYLDFGDNAESMSIPNREGLKWINLAVGKPDGSIKYIWRRYSDVTQIFSTAVRKWVDAKDPQFKDLGLKFKDPQFEDPADAPLADVPADAPADVPADVPSP